ncbi:MAG: GNAT family N-acetyltransferase [Rhodoferax sp.]
MKALPTFTENRRGSLEGYDRIDIDLPEARIGNIRCRLLGEKAIVYSIQIFPEFQGNGYGAAAIRMLKSRYAVLVADRVRFTARAFWEKMGFQEAPDGNWEYRNPRRAPPQ